MTTVNVMQAPPTVVMVQPETMGNKLAAQNQREWSTGLCDCCLDCCSCCYAYFCWWCFMCTLSQKLGENYCGPLCCREVFMIPMYTKTRTMYGIKGGICKDICCVGCCTFCTMTQIWRELEAMGGTP